MTRASIATLILLAVAKLAIHLATNGRYGFHRDELYYLACGEHLSWGYVDHPPLAPWIARVASGIAGPSLTALRLVPALCGAACVFLAGWMAARLGGGRLAQALAALAVIGSPLYLLGDTMFQTLALDQLAWTVALSIALAQLQSEHPRRWLWFGLVAGLGVLAKYTFLALGAGLFVGLLLAARDRLRSREIWIGAALALALVIPNLLWQAGHGWATLEFIRNNRANDDVTRLDFVLTQLILMGPVAVPLAVAGLFELFSARAGRVRVLGWTCVVVFAVFVATRAKPYYPGPLYPLLFAAGAVALDRALHARRLAWARPVAVAALIAGSIPLVPVALPILPVGELAARQDGLPHEDFQNMVGWPELAEQVAGYYRELPPERRAGLRIVTSNYGTAGAIDRFGRERGLPAAISGHNTWWWWEEAPVLDPVITVGFRGFRLKQRFAVVDSLGAVATPHGIVNEETGRGIFYCRGLVARADTLWRAMRHYD